MVDVMADARRSHERYGHEQWLERMRGAADAFVLRVLDAPRRVLGTSAYETFVARLCSMPGRCSTCGVRWHDHDADGRTRPVLDACGDVVRAGDAVTVKVGRTDVVVTAGERETHRGLMARAGELRAGRERGRRHERSESARH
jgi:hypothetical protein